MSLLQEQGHIQGKAKNRVQEILLLTKGQSAWILKPGKRSRRHEEFWAMIKVLTKVAIMQEFLGT